MSKLSPGNCPYCDAENGSTSGWGMSPEGWANYKKNHDAGHPTPPTPEKFTKIDTQTPGAIMLKTSDSEYHKPSSSWEEKVTQMLLTWPVPTEIRNEGDLVELKSFIKSLIEKARGEGKRDALIEVLAKLESAGDAKTARHFVKEIMLNQYQ